MDFKTALSLYEYNVRNLQHRYKHDCITKETRDAALSLNHSWFRDVLLFDHIDDSFEEVTVDMLSDDLREKYDITRNRFSLCSVIFYRDHEIPCYNDDYGQQVFAVYNGETWSGGAYNFDYAKDFCSMLDDRLEAEMLNEIAEEYKQGE